MLFPTLPCWLSNVKIQLGSPKGMRSIFQVSTPYRDKKSHLWQHIQEGFVCLFLSETSNFPGKGPYLFLPCNTTTNLYLHSKKLIFPVLGKTGSNGLDSTAVKHIN